MRSRRAERRAAAPELEKAFSGKVWRCRKAERSREGLRRQRLLICILGVAK